MVNGAEQSWEWASCIAPRLLDFLLQANRCFEESGKIWNAKEERYLAYCRKLCLPTKDGLLMKLDPCPGRTSCNPRREWLSLGDRLASTFEIDHVSRRALHASCRERYRCESGIRETFVDPLVHHGALFSLFSTFFFRATCWHEKMGRKILHGAKITFLFYWECVFSSGFRARFFKHEKNNQQPLEEMTVDL